MGFLMAAGVTYWSAFTNIVGNSAGTANDGGDSLYTAYPLAESFATGGMMICCVSSQIHSVEVQVPTKTIITF